MLEVKEAELQCKEVELQRERAAVTTLTDTLVQKDVILEARKVALRDTKTALAEKAASLSALQERWMPCGHCWRGRKSAPRVSILKFA